MFVIQKLVRGEISGENAFTDRDSNRLAEYWPDIPREDWPMPREVIEKAQQEQARQEQAQQKGEAQQKKGNTAATMLQSEPALQGGGGVN